MTLKQRMAVWLGVGVVMTGLVVSAQTGLVPAVRAEMSAGRFDQAERLVADSRRVKGVTPEMLEALSWLGRGSLAANALDRAERYARETFDLSRAQLRSRPLDQEPSLPLALGAAIEVLSQVEAARGNRTDAVVFLEQQLRTYATTSVATRIQKNINLISLAGQPAPPLVVGDHLGAVPRNVSELRGQVVLLFFWAHWCADCKAQGPILDALMAKHRAAGLVLLAPTQRYGYVAGGADAAPQVETRYIDQVRQTAYPVLKNLPIPLDAANHRRYGVSTTPTLVLVDRGGIVRLYHPGRMTFDELDTQITALLRR